MGLYAMTLILNSLFGADARYEHAITTKLGGILVNLTTCLPCLKGFCATKIYGFFPAIFVIFFMSYL